MLRRGKDTPRIADRAPAEAEFSLNSAAEHLPEPALVSAARVRQEQADSAGPADPFVTTAPARPSIEPPSRPKPAPEPSAPADRGGRLRRPLRARRGEEVDPTPPPAP